MGFYGNIKATSRAQFSFDKVYSSRAQMEKNMATDGIYAGRFVLIEYDNRVDLNSFPQGYLKDGIVYQTIPSTAETVPIAYRYAEPEEKNNNSAITPGSLVYIPIEYNFDKTYYDAKGEKTDTPRAIFLLTTTSEKTKKVPVYQYDAKTGVLIERVDNGNPIEHEVTYVEMVPFNQGVAEYAGAVEGNADAYSNYIFNYNEDRLLYGVSRGYDGTVWQKVYENTASKYVMVAELNSVVPTFDLAADSPTMVPIQPHFDTSSTNVYYKLHMQPQWGFRIKSTDPNLLLPKLKSSGEPSAWELVPSRTDRKEYPSDVATEWTLNTYNPNNGETTEKVFAINMGNGQSGWVERDHQNADTNVPAAIYFNKAGFNPEKICYSTDKQYAGWNPNANNEFFVSDEISVSPTGQSGHYYNQHQPGVYEVAPDTQELSIMLPSIGDSMAKIWDLIYGGKEVNNGKVRNLDVKWYDAKAVSNKQGIRLINTIGPGRYTYNKDAASTVAGILNSAQDLMGMIITTNIPEDVSGVNGDYIYYDEQNMKYKFKYKNFEYTKATFSNNKIPDNYDPYVPVGGLKEWDQAYFYIDSAVKSGWEFIMENRFYKDRSYVSINRLEGDGAKIEPAMVPIDLSAEYKPDGSFYLLETGSYPSGIKYNYLVSTKESYQENHVYYQFTLAKDQLGRNDAIYIPNKYYYINYEKVELTPTTYEPDTYYFKHEGGGEAITYHLCSGPTMDDNKDLLGSKVTEYYKREYVLSTDLQQSPGRIYYTVLADDSQSSNAYYTQIKEMIPQPTLNYDMYQSGQYYYEVTAEEAKNAGAYEYVSKKYYLLDHTTYTSKESFAEAKRAYYSLKITYKLVQGSDIIEITDENAVKIEKMRDITEFQEGSFEAGSGRDVFYVWVDEQNQERYIEVNYNNFQQSYNSQTRAYELVILDYKKVGKPYYPNGFYYKVTDATSDKKGSYLIDDNAEMTEGRQYYTCDLSKILDFITPGDQLKYYMPNEYYIESPPNSGNYIVADSPNIMGGVNYVEPKNKLYVLEDTEEIYSKGAEWPLEIKQIPDGVTVGTRKEIWELKDLPDFGSKLATLHGLLLELYKHLNADDLTRDNTIMRGALNQFNDLIHRFSKLVPGQFVVIDDYGRIHSAELSTAQGLTYSDGRTQASKENALVTISIDSDFKQPAIKVLHSGANIISDTTSTYDVNDKGDTIDLITSIYDNCGHIVGKNTNTVTLPYAFKTVSVSNSTGTGAITTNSGSAVAPSTQATLSLIPQNKWIELAASGTTIQLAHSIVNDSWNGEKSNSQDSTPSFGNTFNVPVITVDNAGHVTGFKTETVKIPGLIYTDDNTANNDVVLNIAYNYDTTTDIGTFTETRGKVDTLLIQDYDITGVASAKLTNTDKIHEAFEKLQAQINGMDLTKKGGEAGDYLKSISVEDGIVTVEVDSLPTVSDTAVTGQYISQISQTYGKIEISREDFIPSITIEAGTSDNAPTVNVTVNSKSGTPQALTIASTEAYGVTKLTNSYSSASTNLALTGMAVNEAFTTLKANGELEISASKTIKGWKEENGIVSIEIQDILITDDNIAEDAGIQMTKIDGLDEALEQATNDAVGSDDNTSDDMTVYGVSKKVDSVIGTEDDDSSTVSILGLVKKTDDIIGTEEDDDTQKTIYGLLAKIATLEAKIDELHGIIKEEPTPDNGEEPEGGEVEELPEAGSDEVTPVN